MERGGAGGVGATAVLAVPLVLDSNSGSDNKGSRASASSKPSGSGGVRYNKVTDADVARVRAKTAEAKAKQTPASVMIKTGDTLSDIAKTNDVCCSDQGNQRHQEC